MSTRHILIACSCALAVVAPAAAAERDPASWKIGSGYAASSGRYGATEATTFSTIPLSLEWFTPRWSLQANLSYLRRRGPTGVVIIPDGGALAPAQPVAVIDSAQGFGDSYFSATRYYLLDQHASGVNLHLRGSYKLATGSRERGLSTGKNDLSAAVEVTRFFGALEAAATISYTRPGKVEAFALRNHVSSRWRGRWSASETLAIELSYHAGQRVAAASEGPRDATLGLEWQPARNAQLYLYAMKGYSTGSADTAGGLTFSRSF